MKLSESGERDLFQKLKSNYCPHSPPRMSTVYGLVRPGSVTRRAEGSADPRPRKKKKIRDPEIIENSGNNLR